jgi:hypothetical protein
MTDHLFLITGGGTGAKVAEAFVHLCAAGLGPKEAHILLVDADTDNGNLNRAVDAARAYGEMARWPWSVRGKVGKKMLGIGGTQVSTRLFATKLFVYQLTKPVESTNNGGLRTAAAGHEGLSDVLDLFYDPDEQDADCTDGFRARPNLGCLLMADHLRDSLTYEPEAKDFLNALGRAAASGSAPVPVVVAASVFGGTGASLLPVAQGCVEQALRRLEKQVSPQQLRWSAVKMLPHYQPEKRAASVDPDRFLLDTSSALQFYAAAYQKESDRPNGQVNGQYASVYVVGSDNPSRNTVKVSLGKSNQSNPAYVEETVAALAVLDAAQSGSAKPVRVLADGGDLGGLKWNHLPGGEEARESLGYLLHLAAFFMRDGNRGQLTFGLRQLLVNESAENLWAFDWYRALLDDWASHFDIYKQASKSDRPAMLMDPGRLGDRSIKSMLKASAGYFGRLLLWAETSLLKGEGVALADYASNKDYSAIFTQMSELKASDVNTVDDEGAERQVLPEDDNALVRLLRAATASMAARQQGSRGGWHLYDPDSGRVLLGVTRDHILEVLEREDHGSVEDAFTKTVAG